MLTELKLKTVKPAVSVQKLSDGGGLQLWVTPAGGKYWRLAYRFDGKQCVLALGVYPQVSLKDARKARDEAKQLVSEGVNPNQQRKLNKLTAVSQGMRQTWRVMLLRIFDELRGSVLIAAMLRSAALPLDSASGKRARRRTPMCRARDTSPT